ncbi:MAG: hypothetical protein Q8O94_03555 [bacterium]|nr:hypothetical protein [bacterium]
MARKRKAVGINQTFVNVFPVPIVEQASPTTGDAGFEIGQVWINTSTDQAWTLTSVVAGSATWALSSPGASDVDTITADSGGALSPLAGNITVAGGTNITTAGAGSTVTVNLDGAITLATSVTSPIFTTAAGTDLAITGVAGQDIIIKMGDAAGANKISFTDSADAEVASLDSDGALTIVGALSSAGLTFTGLLTAAASATIDTAGTTLSLGADNDAAAIILGGGTVARAITIGQDAAAHTITIGQAAAGAITVDTAAGISLDAATASNFTVTGAANLTLESTAGSAQLLSAQAAVTAVLIHASNAAGGVTIRAGTGGVFIATDPDTSLVGIGDIAPTASRTITLLGGTVVTAAVTDTLDLAPDGATTNANSIKTVNINAGGVTLGQVLTNIATGAVTSGTHTTSIATGNRAAGTMALNVFTGTGTKTANFGNADALSTFNFDGVMLINDSINANTSINTGTSTGSVAIGNALSGAVTIDSVGVVELNSAGAAIGIGTDANNFAVNIATGGDRTTTIGNATGANGLVFVAGTDGITFTGTVKEIDAQFLAATGDDITFQQSPLIGSALNTGVAATGATGDVNLLSMQNGVIMEQFVLGAGQTIIKPVMEAEGLLVSGDLTATEGYEYNFGAARVNSRHAFTIGTDAAFFFECEFTVADVSGANPYMIGFRKSEANNASVEAYTDYALIGLSQPVNEGTVIIKTELNGGGTTNTNTTDAWADAATHTLAVLVSAAGVVTYTIDGVAPTATAAYTFDNGDVVCPLIVLLHGAAAPGEVHLNSMKIGFQA